MLSRLLPPLTRTASVASHSLHTMVKLDAGNSADLKEGSMKEVPLDPSDSKSPKVLLAKINGKVFATSSKCTHYGAPLAKGILNTKTCTVRCPWHGAKFNVCTGDIEDTPGLGSLLSFNVVEIDGKLFVEASEEDIKTFSKPVKPCRAEREESVVVIGGGSGGHAFIEQIRESGFKGKVTLVTYEEHLPIDRTKLSKALTTDPTKISLRDDAFYKSLDITILTGTTAESLDLEEKRIYLSDSKTIPYTYLVYAAGSIAKTLPLPGSDLEGILTLRNIGDADKINNVLGTEDEKSNVVIIGTSFIGMELALVASKKANVTMVGTSKAPFEKVLGEQVGNAIRKSHEKQGVKFYMNADLEKFVPSKNDPTKVGGVKLKSGQVLECTAVIVGVGAKPQTSLLAKSGIKLEQDDSVRVDESLKVIDSKAKGHVYAVGDVATFPDALSNGQSTRVEHWNVAGNHARTVARTIGSRSPVTYNSASVFWSAQGSQIRYVGTGRASQWNNVHVIGNIDEFKFVAYYSIGEDVVAVASCGRDPVVSKCTELFNARKMPTFSQIKLGTDPLEIKL